MTILVLSRWLAQPQISKKMSSCLFECLKEAGIEKYYPSFQHRGFDTAFSLLYVRPAELQDVGITTDTDRQRFLQLVQIIASFHQGGELSPRRIVSLRHDTTMDTPGRVDMRLDEQRSSRYPNSRNYTGFDSFLDSDSTDHISLPKRKDRQFNGVRTQGSIDGNMPVLSANLQNSPHPSAGLGLKLRHFRTKSAKSSNPNAFLARHRVEAAEENYDRDHNRNNNNMHCVGGPPSQSQICESHPIPNAATEGCRIDSPAELRNLPPQNFNALKVQKVIRSEGYNYGLPKENVFHHDGDAANSNRTILGMAHRNNLSNNKHRNPPSIHLTRDTRPLPKACLNQRIMVCVRKRPLVELEHQAGEFDVITCNQEAGGKEGRLVIHELKRTVDMSEFVQQNVFQFDKVFAEDAMNKDVYNTAIQPLVEWIMTKNNRATCFGYGQTGAGKTHTLLGDQGEPGVFLHAAKEVLSRLASRGTSIRPSKRGLSLLISLYEIYCSRIFDLLNDHKRLQALEDSNKQVQIHGLKKVPVENMESLLQVLHSGLSTRSTGVTGANQDSSRSHAIVQLTLQDVNNCEHSRLSFIDLAGSERACDALKDSDKRNRLEGAEINQSLLALKECIRSLDLELSHTPFRQSKLTQVLRDSFTGNSKTCMISNISPSYSSLEHTMNTLRYANRVKELHRRPATVSSPPKRNRVNNKLKRGEPQRTYTANAKLGRTKLPAAAANSRANRISSAGSVSVESCARVPDYSTYTGNGVELSRTPPPILDECNELLIENDNQQVPKASQVQHYSEMAHIGTPFSVEEIEHVAAAQEQCLDDNEMLCNVSTEIGSYHMENKDAERCDNTEEMAESHSLTGEVDSADGETEEKILVTSCSIPEYSGLHCKGISESAASSNSQQNVSNVTSHCSEIAQTKDPCIISNFETGSDQDGTNTSDKSRAFTEATTLASYVDITEDLCGPSVVQSRNKIPHRSKIGLSSPQRFLTYLKDRHGLKTKHLKQRLRRVSRREGLALSDTNAMDEEGTDHSTSSSTISTYDPSATCSAPESIRMTRHQKDGEPIVQGPVPLGLPSPMLDRSLPRQGSRPFHGTSTHSSSPNTGSAETNKSYTEMEKSSYDSVRRAKSEVVIAHQEHISEILRISIEEERLYNELREEWGNSLSFETYTKSLQKLLTRKTRSIEALKVQLALYDRVCGTKR